MHKKQETRQECCSKKWIRYCKKNKTTIRTSGRTRYLERDVHDAQRIGYGNWKELQ